MSKTSLDDQAFDQHADILEKLAAHYRNVIDSLTSHGNRAISAFEATGFHQKQADAYRNWLQFSFLEQEIDRFNQAALHFRTLAQQVRDTEKLFS